MKDGTNKDDSNKVVRDIKRNIDDLKTIEFRTDRAE